MPSRTPPSDDSLKRERAGTYRTRDGRFNVEQSSSGWLVYDAEQTDELGLPLARGPFPTLNAAKAALAAARSVPSPTSSVSRKDRGAAEKRAPTAPARPRLVASRSQARAGAIAPADGAGEAPDRTPAGTPTKTAQPARPVRPAQPAKPTKAAKPPIVIRDIRAVDAEALRALWKAAGFRPLGDDDLGLARLARRNPGLVVVAAEGSRVVGSALGAWDGRRGWIYHVAVAPSHRRQGIATRLIDQVEAGLRALGCRKVNVMVRPDSDGGAAFWESRGYESSPAAQYGRELAPD